MSGELIEGQEGMVEHGEDLSAETPLIYLAMPLSHLASDRDREHVELLAEAVNRAIQEKTRDAEEPWPTRVHSPIKWSAPWKGDGLKSDLIYRQNSDRIWLEADALIVIADRGGSLGIGQELAWACDLQLPVLYLHPKADPISRQVLGAASEHDLEFRGYRNGEHIEAIVRDWLKTRKSTIRDGARRRIGAIGKFTPLLERLRKAWEAASAAERKHVGMVTRIPPARIERVLSSPLVLAAASHQEISALQAALRVEPSAGARAKRLPALREGQVKALNLAAMELGWDFEKALRLRDNARRELGKGGVRRLPLASVQDWAEFSERYDN